MMESSNESKNKIDLIIPKEGLIYKSDNLDYILCKPKLMPLKSITLEKLEKMQKEAEMKVSELEKTEVTNVDK